MLADTSPALQFVNMVKSGLKKRGRRWKGWQNLNPRLQKHSPQWREWFHFDWNLWIFKDFLIHKLYPEERSWRRSVWRSQTRKQQLRRKGFLASPSTSSFDSCFTLAEAVNMDRGAESISHEMVVFQSFSCALHHQLSWCPSSSHYSPTVPPPPDWSGNYALISALFGENVSCLSYAGLYCV